MAHSEYILFISMYFIDDFMALFSKTPNQVKAYLRNSGDYPFYPVDVFGPYSAQEVWDFADHTDGRLLPVVRDEEASEFVAREWQEAEEARMQRERDQS